MNFEEWWKQNTGGVDRSSPLALEVWRAAAEFEREACAKVLEMKRDELLLMAGEMTAQELRTVQSVLKRLALAMRCRSDALNEVRHTS